MNKELSPTEWVSGTARHPLLCKWWMRTRQISGDPASPGGALCEFYIPFWAWPLELLHRAIFGNTKMQG